MTTKSTVGWLILAFSLIVPGMIFYQWYVHTNDVRMHDLNVKVRSRLPEGGPFAIPPSQNKPITPIPEISSAPVAAAAEVSAVPAAVSEDKPEPPAPEAAVPAPSVQASSAPAIDFHSWRDPTLSPYDKILMERLEMERQLKIHELQDASHKARRSSAQKESGLSSIIKRLDLQGIVSKPGGGNSAIVNGQAVQEGDLIGEVKVLRITPQKVVFSYKNRRFIKSLNQ